LDNTFQGISRLPQMPESVTYVLGKSVTYVPGRTNLRCSFFNHCAIQRHLCYSNGYI
jgi:hypothetical protein